MAGHYWKLCSAGILCIYPAPPPLTLADLTALGWFDPDGSA